MADLASLAQSIKDNEAFQAALDGMRSDALESLARAIATDADKIRDLQARIRVVDELRGNLEDFIRQGQPKQKPGIV
jgi:uncharacterized protein YeeX (DUF496 family)